MLRSKIKKMGRKLIGKIVPEVFFIKKVQAELDFLRMQNQELLEKANAELPNLRLEQTEKALITLREDAGLSYPDSWSDFYANFEDRFRGSFDLILDRLKKRYLPILTEENLANTRAIDIGCGNGETLDMLKSAGYNPTGIDISMEAVKRCLSKGHPAIQMDALTYLKTIETDSVGCITYLHVIEHCSAPYSFELTQEIYRVLAKGGKLIIETPNLKCLFVAARQFYLDPTHLRPVHPDYISFLAGFAGFEKIKEYYFDGVEHPDFPPIKSEEGNGLSAVNQWAYGAMDFALYGEKPGKETPQTENAN